MLCSSRSRSAPRYYHAAIRCFTLAREPTVAIVRETTMSRDARFDVLFEPVKIGPVTARNRFYQVPHCNGMGRTYPTEMAVMRGHKAEGGWAVVCTEQCER